ncbi:MAG: twin-arginine translocase TatA/TatE family subunit [Bacteroidetes bacterium]|nr:twin-arginine translocase TatA/TatE family subunit [Bacteroidota bacterium]
MLGIGTPEMIMIVVAILVLFGAKKIPEFMRGLGKGVSEFKKGMSDIQQELQSEVSKEDQLRKREEELARKEAELQKRLDEKK